VINNHKETDQIALGVRRTIGTESSNKKVKYGNWGEGVWTHVVGTVQGSTMALWVDGVLMGTKENGWEPEVLQRSGHYFGKGQDDGGGVGYFRGELAFVRIWHGTALGEVEVGALFDSA
jgi:hypothetical protein